MIRDTASLALAAYHEFRQTFAFEDAKVNPLRGGIGSTRRQLRAVEQTCEKSAVAYEHGMDPDWDLWETADRARPSLIQAISKYEAQRLAWRRGEATASTPATWPDEAPVLERPPPIPASRTRRRPQLALALRPSSHRGDGHAVALPVLRSAA